MDRRELRWNGWGRRADAFDLGDRGPAVWSWLADALGMGSLPDRPPCALEDVTLPEPRLPAAVLTALREVVTEPWVKTDTYERAFHARGRSYPDLLALRSGAIDPAPDAVVYPADAEQVLALVELADAQGVALVPYGGGSSVVGGVTAQAGPQQQGVVTVDMTRLDRVLEVDEQSMTAHIQAGIYGPALEAALEARGVMLGHYPQSFEFSTLGGWIAARGAGQQSNRYGKAEEWLVGATIATPAGLWTTEAFPASAAGPGVGGLVAGAEGTLGIITDARVRLHHRPRATDYRGYLFRSFGQGTAAAREIMQRGLPVAMIRLSDADETHFLQKFSQLRKPPSTARRTIDELLAMAGWGGGRAMMLVGIEGEPDNVKAAQARTAAILRRHRAFPLGQSAGRSWHKGRFAMPYLRDPLLDRGVAVDTLETSTSWSNIERLHRSVGQAIAQALAEHQTSPRDRAMVMCHISHCYEDGASLYFTFVFPQAHPDALGQWRAVKTAATEAIVTGDLAAADRFTTEVDAAAVVVNASTRFVDGEEFGFGAEIGISTQKLHARGPMGLEQLTTQKYVVRGTGQVRG